MKRKIDTTIQFSGLKSGSYDYSYVLDGTFFSEFENDEILDGTVNFEVKLEKKERVMMFNFAFNGVIETKCDRCLGELEVPVEGEQLLCVKFEDEATENNDEDVLILPTSEHTIDLAQWMYEYVVVAMPFQKVHAEGECDPEVVKYISAEGEEEDDEQERGEEGEREVDPRWEALLKLKK